MRFDQLPLVVWLCGLSLGVSLVGSGWAQDGSLSKVVVRSAGDDGSFGYRIPGLAVSNQGTLIACFDIRWNSLKDLPANIDVGVMRSTDSGQTWGPMIVAMDFDQHEPGSLANGVGDAAILVDRRSDTIYLAALWSYGDRAWHHSGAGLSKEQTGQLVICTSHDDGVTWDAPRSITSQVKKEDWLLCFQGPGAGIQLRDGTLVFSAQYKNAAGHPTSCFIHSRDGNEWQISPAAIPSGPPTSESQLVQLPDDSLLITMRNESRAPERLWARWQWAGELSEGKWSQSWTAVRDPICMASLLSHPSGKVLLSNNNSTKRERLSIRVSEDQGQSWTDGRLLDGRPTAYSCMALLPDNQIGILYEVGDKHSTETLTFAKFSLEWALQASGAAP